MEEKLIEKPSRFDNQLAPPERSSNEGRTPIRGNGERRDIFLRGSIANLIPGNGELVSENVFVLLNVVSLHSSRTYFSL